MADYVNFQSAIDSGITNMTVIRNNTSQDDGTDVVETGIDWFIFNSQTITKLYISGNSYIGFGVNSEHICVNRRDTKMYYLYSESGSIGNIKFFKIRWRGYSAYNYTSSSYAQEYDIFLLDTGQIILNFYKVPSSQINGTNKLVCGNETLTYNITSNTPCSYTFTSESNNGTSWVISEGFDILSKFYKLNGTVEFEIDEIKNINKVYSSYILWDEEVPAGASIKLYSKLDNGEYTECENGGHIKGVLAGSDLTNRTLWIKAELSTSDKTSTPLLKNINVKIFNEKDNNILILTLGNGNRNSIQNAIGYVTVDYAGGTIKSNAESIKPFNKTFMPEGLISKNNFNNIEHIELSNVTVKGGLFVLNKIPYELNEHIELSNIDVVGVLTHINDI